MIMFTQVASLTLFNAMFLRPFSVVSAAMVKKLRELTGAPMMDCKNALQHDGVDGDMEKAVEVLRKQGMKRVNKVSSRTTTQGLITAKKDEKRGVLVELCCETDFVARNDIFQKLARDITDIVFKTGVTNIQEVKALSLPNGLSVETGMKEVIAKMGENVLLRRSDCIDTSSPNAILCSYLHNTVSTDSGQIATLVSFGVDGDKDKVDHEILHKISMHIVAASPTYLTREEIPSDLLNRERELIIETVSKVNKPVEILNKMVEGKLSEYYRQNVLLDQLFALDEKQGTVQKILLKIGKEAGCSVSIEKFIRMHIGQ